MKSLTSALTALFCVATVITCLILTWQLRTSTRDIENKHTALAARNDALKKQLHAQNVRSVPAPATAHASTPVVTSKRETTLERLTRQTAEQSLASERLKKDPELQKKYFAAMRVDIGIAYGPFFHKTNLTPDETGKLTTILAHHEEYKTDIAALRTAPSSNRSDPIWSQLQREARKEMETSAQTLLGNDTFAQFQIYEREKTAWDHVGHLAAGLALADLPMSFEQSEQLVQIMANASPFYMKGKAVNMEEVDWNVADAEAQKILTPEQFELFSTTQFIGVGGTGRSGGFSRWSAEFSKALNNAMTAERSSAPKSP